MVLFAPCPPQLNVLPGHVVSEFETRLSTPMPRRRMKSTDLLDDRIIAA